MATYSIEYERNLRRFIRDIKAVDPLITTLTLTERLSQRFSHDFDRHYIAKLVRKVERETLHEVDAAKIEKRLSGIRENYRIVRERLAQIVFWQPDPDNPTERKPAKKDVIEAAKNMVMLDLAVFNAEMSNGLYKKPIEEIAKTFQYEPLSGEVRAVVIAAWTRGGLLPRETVDQMVPKTAHST